MASREDEDEKVCRLCRGGEDDGPLVLSCACRGSAKWIHKACLEEWQRTGSREDTADRCGQCKDEYDELLSAMPDEDLLSGLPLELQMHVADAVGERCDRAALALASPRLLGLAACRGLRSYQGLEMSLAFHHVLGGAIDEQLLRRYASRAEATLEGCGWLTGVAAAAGLRRLRITGSDPGPGPGSVRGVGQGWYLMQCCPAAVPSSSTVGALLRIRMPQMTEHYEGAEGAERRVRSDLPDGDVHYFEGAKGAERLVRERSGQGNAVHYFEGEKGLERLVRGEQYCGDVHHYEGEQELERMVRCELPSGEVFYHEGEQGVERMVRCELPCGDVLHYDGEKNAERIVRYERHGWGVVFYYEGEKGAEQMVRLGLPFGISVHFRGFGIAVLAAVLAAIINFILTDRQTENHAA